MPENPETVTLDEAAVGQIAARVADILATREPEKEPERSSSSEEPAWAKALSAQLGELKALANTPQRTELDDGGVKSKPGEGTPIYGGNDRYSGIGSDDAEVATNLWLAREILSSAKAYTPTARLSDVMLKAAERAMKAPAPEIPRYATDSAGYRKALDVDRFVSLSYRAGREEAAKAMTSTGVGAGDEWVPTFATAELWRDVHLDTAVAASIQRVDMPTNPYDLPTLSADVTFRYASAENTAVTASDPTTAKATLTAAKIQAEVDFSGEATEDSIIPIVPALRANLVRRSAQTIDDLLVHGDTQTAATGNVNSDDAAPAAGSFYLALNGFRKFTVVTNTAQDSAVAAALTTANFTTIRGLLGRYGGRPSDLRLICGQSTLNTLYDITQVKTIDVYGPNATIVQGELARFFGIPIVLSEAIPGTSTDKVDADGKYTTTSPSTNDTKGWLVLVNVNGWKLGFRREFQIESFRDIQKDQNILVASFRQAQIPSGIATVHTASGRNITV